MNELVSIIIPVFNRSQMVVEAIESALSQTYRPIEIIVVDDGSTDGTAATLEELRVHHPDCLKVLRQVNAGPGPARNLGLSESKGDFIQYLDSDDLLKPSKLERQVAVMREHSEAGVSYCVTHRRNTVTGLIIPWAQTEESIENLFPSFLPKRGWATLTPLWRRSVCEQIGPWADFRVMEDWEHDLRAGMLGIMPVHVPEVLCEVRDHEQNRASGMNTGFTRDLTRDFFRAHESVWLHMKSHGLTDWSYTERFSRTMFWVARMCGSFGLATEAELALDYTDEMTEMNGRRGSTTAFRLVKRAVGWKFAVAASERTRGVARIVKGV
ncbi:glycosyltransferase family 2 protein [Pseudomonadota bacterium]